MSHQDASAGPRTVRSADETIIAYEQQGSGPPLVLIEAAGHFRAFSSFDGLAPLLAAHFTVVRYDRRGRGDSADTRPYAPEREVDDLAALIAAVGGEARLYGFSSGALLALHAAARGLAIPRMALLEPPLPDDADPRPSELTTKLTALAAEGRRAEMVEVFHESIGVPAEIIDEMRSSPAWAYLVSAAPTLVHDCMLADATTSALLRAADVPTLVLDSAGSTDNLTGWAASAARQLPRGGHRSLPGEWHGVADEVLAPVLIEFLTGGSR
jgi:pimeloyl-ACP methyl ester carboxylesterase